MRPQPGVPTIQIRRSATAAPQTAKTRLLQHEPLHGPGPVLFHHRWWGRVANGVGISDVRPAALAVPLRFRVGRQTHGLPGMDVRFGRGRCGGHGGGLPLLVVEVARGGRIRSVRPRSRVDLTRPVHQYFQYVQKAVELNRDLATAWAETVMSLSGVVREHAEKVSHIVKDQTESVADLAHEQAEKAEQAAREQAEQVEQAEKEQARRARQAEREQAEKIEQAEKEEARRARQAEREQAKQARGKAREPH